MSRYAHDSFAGWLSYASFLDVHVTHLSDGKGLNFAYNVYNRRGICYPTGRGDQGAHGDNVERVSPASRIAQQHSLGRGILIESLYAVKICAKYILAWTNNKEGLSENEGLCLAPRELLCRLSWYLLSILLRCATDFHFTFGSKFSALGINGFSICLLYSVVSKLEALESIAIKTWHCESKEKMNIYPLRTDSLGLYNCRTLHVRAQSNRAPLGVGGVLPLCDRRQRPNTHPKQMLSA